MYPERGSCLNKAELRCQVEGHPSQAGSSVSLVTALGPTETNQTCLDNYLRENTMLPFIDLILGFETTCVHSVLTEDWWFFSLTTHSQKGIEKVSDYSAYCPTSAAWLPLRASVWMDLSQRSQLWGGDGGVRTKALSSGSPEVTCWFKLATH